MLAPIYITFIHTFGVVRWREWFYLRIPYDEIHHIIIDSVLYSHLVIADIEELCEEVYVIEEGQLMPMSKNLKETYSQK